MADTSVTSLPRLSPLAGVAAGITALTALPPRRRLTLHVRDAAREKAGEALGFPLPATCRASVNAARAALWLGPEETLLLTAEDDDPAAALEAALADVPHAIVDVSHRQIGIVIEGAGAAETLNSGCPLDLDESAFPVGMCTRTVFQKAEIVLWRKSPAVFHLEVWRSFAPYVWQLLDEARRQAA